MQSISLHALPDLEEKAWTIENFAEKNDSICRNSAMELQKKSLMIEEAVEEILELVKTSSIDDSSTTRNELYFEGQLVVYSSILAIFFYKIIISN